MLYELRCTRRNVERCLTALLPGWGCCPASRDIEHPGRRALSFPRASLTPQQSQLTLLDFRSMETLTLGGNRLLIKGQTAQEAESVGTTTFSLPFFANHSCKSPTRPKHRSQEVKVQPLLPTSDQELANPPAQGACRNRVKLQQGCCMPHPRAVLAQTSREEAGGSKHLKFTGALRRGEMPPPQRAHSCPGTPQAESFPTLLHSPSSRQQL